MALLFWALFTCWVISLANVLYLMGRSWRRAAWGDRDSAYLLALIPMWAGVVAMFIVNAVATVS